MTNKKTLTLLACIPRSRGHCLQRRKRPRGKKTAHAWRRGHHITSTYLSLTTLAQGPYDSWQLYNHSTSNPAPKGLDISFFATHELHGGESTPVARATFVTLGTDSRVNENHRRALDMLIRTIRQRPSSICVSILWNGYVLRFFFSAPPFCDESAVRKKLSVSKMLFFFTYLIVREIWKARKTKSDIWKARISFSVDFQYNYGANWGTVRVNGHVAGCLVAAFVCFIMLEALAGLLLSGALLPR